MGFPYRWRNRFTTPDDAMLASLKDNRGVQMLTCVILFLVRDSSSSIHSKLQDMQYILPVAPHQPTTLIPRTQSAKTAQMTPKKQAARTVP
jgi:hypothetical protein